MDFGIIYYSSKNLNDLGSTLNKTKLESDIESAKAYFEKFYGNIDEISYSNNKIFDRNGKEIVLDNTIVDTIKDKMGVVATIFVRDENGYKRVVTNIMNNGIRSVGTYLKETNKSYKKVVNGERYIGDVTLFGIDYLSAYEPIIDKNNNIDLIFFIGVSKVIAKKIVNNSVSNMMNYLIIFGSVILIALIIFIYIIGNNIAKPIKKATNYSKVIANGDFTQQIDNKMLKKKDETGMLSKAFVNINNNFKDLIFKIQSSATNVAASSEELTASSEQAMASSQEVERTVEEIAKGANEQAEETNEASESVILLGDIINENINMTKELSNMSKKVNNLANEGLQEIDSLHTITKESKTATRSIREDIEKTDQSAKEIGELSKFISSIAEQTNLLALNAAIEAARAGESGKGFAVVAEEIRKLAEEATKSTNVIDEMVATLQDNVNSTVSTMEEIDNIVETQLSNAKSTESKYNEITKSIMETINIIKRLDSSAIEMEKKRTVIIDIIQNLSAVAQENAASTEEMSASVEELTMTMSEITKASEGLAELAGELQEKILKFKI
jgi:methyl-accepting chemotaxis protein